MSKREEKGLQNVCIFTARVYMRAWMTAFKPASAPYYDYQLLILLLDYSAINSEFSRVMSMKMANHLWYLSPETVGLAFFDDSIDYDTKKQMVVAVKLIEEEQPMNEHSKKISVDFKNIQRKEI